ncbi:MAG: hypothetical protein IIU25_03925 [Oscillospiraceae bacterium]|nr:hypothetical protein [Oscillospiraceae bacterium]
MASSFMGLFVQRDGLNLAQKALDITGSNLTNVQTEGYTRQRLDVVTVKQSSKSLGYTNQIHLAGAGNEGEGVTQTRDDILDAKFRKYTSVHADLETKSNVLSDIEDAIDDIENDSTGFAAVFGKFKDSLQSISSAGTDQTDLANVAKNAAQNVVNVLKNFDSRIDSIAQDTLNDFNATIKRTNDILRQCAKNNEYIKSGYVQNNNVYDNGYGFQADVNYGPLEMKDEMNSLIDELSGYFDVSSQVEPDGTFTISISGQQVVYNNTYAKLTADENKTFTNLSVSVTTLKLDTKWKNMRCRYEDGNVDLANGMKDALAAVSEDNTTENMNNMKALTQKLRDGGETALADAIDADLNSGDFEAAGKKIDSYMEDNGYDLVNKINDLLIKGDFESAKNTEDDLMAKLEADGKTYQSLFEARDITEIIKGGSIRADIDMYNGAGDYNVDPKNSTGDDAYANGGAKNSFKGIEFYKKTFNALAASLAKEFNAIYSDYTNAEDPKQSVVNSFKLFDFDAGSEDTVAGLKISDMWENDSLLAVHPEGTAERDYSDSDPLGDYNYNELDNKWVNKLLSVFEKKHQIGDESLEYKFEDFIPHYGNTIGSQIEGINESRDSGKIMLTSVQDARDEICAVSTDEEGVNMLTYQKWYNAMARMVTTLDSLLEKLINGTGQVGL